MRPPDALLSHLPQGQVQNETGDARLRDGRVLVVGSCLSYAAGHIPVFVP